MKKLSVNVKAWSQLSYYINGLQLDKHGALTAFALLEW